MKRAYYDYYLSFAMDQTADFFDFAVNTDGRNIDDFTKDYFLPLFAPKIETADPFFLCGKSSIENYRDTMNYPVNPKIVFFKSEEYWAGWVLAFTQWYCNRPFAELLSVIPASRLVRMYYPLHEADETHTADIFEEELLRRDLERSDAVEDAIAGILSVSKPACGCLSGLARDAVLFRISRLAALAGGLTKGYRKDAAGVPWEIISGIAAKAPLGKPLPDLPGLLRKLEAAVSAMEALRPSYVERILVAHYGSYPPEAKAEMMAKEDARRKLRQGLFQSLSEPEKA